MKTLLVIAAILLVPALAWAQEAVAPTPETDCKFVVKSDATGKQAWFCPVPSRPVTCNIFASDLMFCSGPLKKDQLPNNCRWKNGKLSCW